MGASLGYMIIDRILSGVSTRDAVFESLGYFRNNSDWESIKTENELLSFNGTVAAFSPEFRLESSTPNYKVYSFKVYCPDLIGSVYDADDPHPYRVKVYLPADLNPNENGFVTKLAHSFETGDEIRDFLKFLYAPGESVFKSMEIVPEF